METVQLPPRTRPPDHDPAARAAAALPLEIAGPVGIADPAGDPLSRVPRADAGGGSW